MKLGRRERQHATRESPNVSKIEVAAAEPEVQLTPGSQKKEKRQRAAWEKGLPPKWEARTKNAAGDSVRRQDLERKNCSKYHYVKFIERQKVERKVRSVRKTLETARHVSSKAVDVGSLESELKEHYADIEYIDHYPRHLPYNALFPKEDSDSSKRRREEVRAIIREGLAKRRAAGESLNVELRWLDGPKAGASHDGDTKDAGSNSVRDMKKSKTAKRAAKRAKVAAAAAAAADVATKVDAVDKSASPVAATGKLDEGQARGKAKRRRVEEWEVPGDPASGGAAKKKRKATPGVAINVAPEGADVHASWSASKSAKVSGALVKSKGKLKVFGENDAED